MVRKRTFLLLPAMVMAAAVFLTGCTTEAAKTRQEYKEKGISQMEEGDFAGAVESFQAALDTSVGTVRAEEIDICYYKALALYKSGDIDGAVDAYTALADFDGDNWEVYYLRGCVYLADGQNENALDDFSGALVLNPDDADMCISIFENLAEAGMEDEAQPYMDVVFAMDPTDGEDYYYLGEAYYLTGNYEDAKLNLISSGEQGYDQALLLLGTIYFDEGSDEDALAAFDSYMEIYPDDAEVLNKMGEIALSAGEYAEALDYFESAGAAMGGNPTADILKNMIAAYEYMGDFQSAFDTAEEFLKKYSDADVEREYIFLETRVAGLSDTETPGESEDVGEMSDPEGVVDDTGTADDAGDE